MGCISSKNAWPDSPEAYGGVSSSSSRCGGKRRKRCSVSSYLSAAAFGPLDKIKEEPQREGDEERGKENSVDSRYLGDLKKGPRESRSVFSFKFGRLTEGEHVAAGWPAWLSAVAGEAIDGWLPLRSDCYERLDKIGQGTYSDVYRARELETGRILAVKKVRFDNFQPESVRFMAREILILRKLDHPNVMKLEGIITSRLSSHIHLVFEYMEHDLSGLLSSPDIKFTDSQIKCYMKQLLSGVEHCHSRGILHRDIKTSNILVNNQGVLKLADFGLANFVRPKNKEPLTSRVVTLWYRPPELLLGATDYGEEVDLWSVGCVFSELFIGRPILKGRTEVEQLHKIFRLCGSPPDDYWRESKLPLAHMFKPQHPYESALRERCKELPTSAVSLIETFLSIEPYKRGTASSSLNSKYFLTKPYACDPESLPKYPPSKEINAKHHEQARRKRMEAAAQAQLGSRNSRVVRKTLQESTDFFKIIPSEGGEANQAACRSQDGSANVHYKRRGGIGAWRPSGKQFDETRSEASQLTQDSQGSQVSTTLSVPVQTSSAWPTRPKHVRFSSQSQNYISIETPRLLQAADDAMNSNELEICDSSDRMHFHGDPNPSLGHSSNFYVPQELYMDAGNKKKNRVAFSGPVIHHYELPSNEQHQQVRPRSRFSYQD